LYSLSLKSKEKRFVDSLKIIKLFNSLINKSFLKPISDVIEILESIIKKESDEFEEEWEYVLEFVKRCLGNPYIEKSAQDIDIIRQIFGFIRNIYIAGTYKGSIDELMNTYLMFKNQISDPLLDTLYINYLIKNCDNMTLKDTLMNFISSELSLIKNKETTNIRHVSRIMKIFGTLESVYLNTRHLDILRTLEQLILESCSNWHKFPTKCHLRIIGLLEEVGLRSINQDIIKRVVEILLEIVLKKDKEIALTKSGTSPTKRKLVTVSSNNNLIEVNVLSTLFKLFYRSYLNFPADSLMHVLNGFLNLVEEGDKSTKITSLRLFANLRYTADEYVSVEQWRAVSHLKTDKDKNPSFDIQRLINAILELLNSKIDPTIISETLSVLFTIAKGHFTLDNLNFNELLNLLFKLSEQHIEAKEINIPIQIGIFIESLVFQKGNDTGCLLLLFNSCLNQLDNIMKLVTNQVDELMKKTAKKVQILSHKHTQEILFSQKTIYTNFTELAKLLMEIMSKAFYVERKELVLCVERLITTISQYILNHILAEKLSNTIQNVISNLYYSEYLPLLPKESLINLLDICFQIGWHSVFHLMNLSMPSLQECFNKGLQSSLTLLITEELIGSVKDEIILPDNETGKKIIEEPENRLRQKKRKEGITDISYFDYQLDDSDIMHITTMNIIRIFIELIKKVEKKEEKVIVLGYILKLVSVELKNEQSKIQYYSVILAELAEWYYSSNAERTVNGFNGNMKLWVHDNTLMAIESDSTELKVDIRNIVSHSSFNIKLEEATHHTKDTNSNDKLEEIKNPSIDPVYVLSKLPYSFYLRENRHAWKPIEYTSEVKAEINVLDNLPVYEKHNVSVLYAALGCTFTDNGFYLTKEKSEQFEWFLSKLGTLIKDNTEIMWCDQFTQILFNVNTLMTSYNTDFLIVDKHEEALSKVKECLDNNNVWILWNESGIEISEKILKNKKALAFIIIIPLKDSYCQIQTYLVIFLITCSKSVGRVYGTLM